MADTIGLRIVLWEPVLGKVGKAGDSEAGPESWGQSNEALFDLLKWYLGK